MVPGTGFPHGGDGVCEAFLNALDPSRFTARVVSYAAGYGFPAYASSVAAGRAALIEAIRATSNPAVIGGFSQGAEVAGNVAAEIGRGGLPGLEVVGCALLADPSRPEGAGMPGRAPVSGYGISGQRRVDRIPTWWAAAVGDPITSLGAGSPLRSIADLTEFYSIASPQEALAWGQDLLDRARRGRWQQWWNPANWRTWGGAARDAYNYLPVGGRHGAAYVLEGYCRDLAAVINREIPPTPSARAQAAIDAEERRNR